MFFVAKISMAFVAGSVLGVNRGGGQLARRRTG
jgi:hypothetical protein